MSSSDFMLDIIAALNKQLSKTQIKNDLKGLNNSLYLKVIARLSTSLSKKQLKNELKQLNDLYVHVATKVKMDESAKKKLLDENRKLEKELSNLQLKISVDKSASVNTVQSVINTVRTAQQYADKTSITLDIEIRKEKAVNDILYIGQKYSKLFSNIAASQKYENLLNSAYSISDRSQLQNVRTQISAFTSELKANGLAVESAGDKWKKLIERAKDLFSAMTLIRVVFTQVRQAISTTINLDKVYTDLVKVNNELNRNDYADYLSKINRKAKELATTQQALIEGATEFSKSGYDLTTSNKLTEKSTILSNVGDMSASDSAKAIISGVQAYDVIDGYTDVIDKAQALIDKYNEIGNTASITTAEIAQGVQKVGSVFADANTSVDEFIALLSAGNRQFQDADNLSLALRTAALRIRGCSAELEAMGEETDNVYTSASKLAEKIEGLTNINGTGGISILEADGETFRSIYDIFLDISKVYKDMSDTDASALLELIAGKNRASGISAVLNNMSEAEVILQNSINAAGSAQKEYDAYLESTEAHIAKFQATLVETYSTFMSGDMISHAADMGTAILNLVNQTDLLKHSILAIFALNIGKGITTIGEVVADTAKQMNALGSALQQVKSLPVDKVLNNKSLNEIGEATKSLTEKNLKLLLSQKNLGEQDKIAILRRHGLTKEEARAKLEKMGLITATNTQAAANMKEAVSTNVLKNAMNSLKASIIGLGTSIKRAFLNNPIGFILTGITTAVSIASTVVSKHNQKLEEMRDKAKEAADKANTLGDEIVELTNKYISLSEAVKTDVNAKEDLMDTQTELLNKLGLEGESIDDLIAKYGSLSNAIRQVSIDTLKDAQVDLIAGVNAAREELLDAAKDNFWGTKNMISVSGKDAVRAFEELEKAGVNGVSHGSAGGSLILIGDDATIDGALENFKILEDAINALRDSEAFTMDELSNNPLFQKIYSRYNEMKAGVDSYRSAIENLNENLSQQTMLTALQGQEIPKTEEAFNTFRQELVDTAVASKQFIGNEKEITDAIDHYLSTVDEFKEYYNTLSETELGKALQNSIRQITDDHGIADREQTAELTECTKDFTASEIELWLQATLGAQNATQAMAMYKKALADAKEASASTPLTITQTVDQISTRLKSAFSSLQSAYQEIFTLDEDTGEKIFASLDEVDITDKFSPILDALQDLDELDGVTVDYSAYEDFVSVLSDTSSTAEEVQEQFDKLATDIIFTSDCTNMSVETFNLLAESLSEMGVSNAYEMLGKIRDAQEELAELSYDAETAIVEEGKSIKELGLASIETEEYLRQYLLQKNLAQNPLSTVDDIAQLEKLCKALGITGEMYEAVNALKNAFESKENGNHSEGIEQSIKDSQQRIQELARGYGYENFKFNFDKPSTSSSKSGSSSSAKDTTETFNWIEQAIENVEKEIKELDEVANSSYSTFSEKNEALAQEIRKVSDEIDLQQQAYAEYMRRAESIRLPEQYKQLVQSGAVNIEDIADENLQDMIGEYQKWYDKAQDVSDAIKDLKTDMKDLYVSVYELQTDNLKDRLDSDSITQKQYLYGLKDAYEQFYADLEDFAEQYHEAVLEYLAEEKDYLNSVAGAASSLLDTEIDRIQDDAQLQEDSIQKQIDLLEAKKKPLQEELDALDDKAKRENLILNLQKAQYELARSENQRTKLLYKDGQMVYTSDSEAIRDAQKGVDDAKLEIQKQSIQDQIDALDDEINRYNDLIDQINNAADVQIDALEKIKNKWQEVIDQQEYAKNVTVLTGEFGESAITKILTGNDDDLLAQWKNNYISTLAGIDMESQGYIGDMTQQIASLYNVDLSTLQSQFQNVTTSIGGVIDALGKATSAVGNGISAPAYEQNAENESASNGSLSNSIKNLGSVSNETLPNVTSNMGAIEETAMSAASEVSNVADAIDNIPESKDVTINIHTVGGNVSGGISSRVSQIAYTGNAYADGTRRAEKGLAVVGEEKPEVVITNDKKALLAEQPTLLNMEGGETVFDGDETAKMLKAKGLRPVTPDEFPLLKAFSQFTPEEIRQKFSLGHVNPARTISSSIAQNASNVNNSSVNHASCTVGDIHIHCPGITKDEVAKQIGTEVTNMFSGLSLKALQRVNITR